MHDNSSILVTESSSIARQDEFGSFLFYFPILSKHRLSGIATSLVYSLLNRDSETGVKQSWNYIIICYPTRLFIYTFIEISEACIFSTNSKSPLIAVIAG
jgi:hypothetical protein